MDRSIFCFLLGSAWGRAMFARENRDVPRTLIITCGHPADHTDQGMRLVAWSILTDRPLINHVHSHLILLTLPCVPVNS